MPELALTSRPDPPNLPALLVAAGSGLLLEAAANSLAFGVLVLSGIAACAIAVAIRAWREGSGVQRSILGVVRSSGTQPAQPAQHLRVSPETPACLTTGSSSQTNGGHNA